EMAAIQALREIEMLKDNSIKYEAWAWLAISANDLQNYQEGIHRNQKALSVLNNYDSDDYINTAICFSNIGYSFMQLREYDSAVLYFEKVKKIVGSPIVFPELYCSVNDKLDLIKIEVNDTSNVLESLQKSE